MKIIVSVATSLDGYLDDLSDKRLIFSSPEDWAEVYRLRASVDAILVGAGTLRADNPGLRAKSHAGRDPLRVTISRSGDLDRSLKFFSDENHLVLKGDLTPAAIIEALAARTVNRLLVEGGAQVLRQFFEAGLVDEMRLAVAPFFVDQPGAPRLTGQGGMILQRVEQLGDTAVMHLLDRDRHHLQTAIDESRKGTPTQTAYCVGAVVVTANGQIFKGFTHETSPADHAEEEAIAKALAAGARLEGATMYASMEPCSQRMSKPVPCSQLIIDHRFARVVYALKEPPRFVTCTGRSLLERAGIIVREIEDLGEQVAQINSHILK